MSSIGVIVIVVVAAFVGFLVCGPRLGALFAAILGFYRLGTSAVLGRLGTDRRVRVYLQHSEALKSKAPRRMLWLFTSDTRAGAR